MFNIEDFDIKLDTRTFGRNFIYSEEITSSNSYLLKDESDQKHGTVFLAEHQSEGKGRLHRPWHSSKGQNLTFSLIIKEKLSSYIVNHINLAASLAVATAIENLHQLKTSLKWPNDVLINNKKVCGILLESSSKGSSMEKIVIGFGVNVNQTKFVGEFKIQPTSVKYELRREVKRERLLSEILNVFEDYLDHVRNDSKFILEEWREKCRMIGEPVTIDIGNEKKFGIFYDIDENGFMILKSGNQIEKINSGDISVR